MNDFEQRIASRLSHINDPIVVGVSGGADSVALLHTLCASGRKIIVVTCDFHLRGDQSTADRQFVASLCRRLGVECIEAHMDVDGFIARHGGSVEMACRDLRYDLFRKVMRERGAARIAVAHNADDNIETLFLNLMRGAGVEGLKGMMADTGEIVRPLLTVSRREIENYLIAKGETWRTDATNLEDGYRRNFIRNRVLPLLEQRWPEARRSIALSQRNLRGEATIINKAVKSETSELLSWSIIEQCGDPRTAIQRFVAGRGASASQIDEMCQVASRRLSGRVWHLRAANLHSERDGLHIVAYSASELPEYHWTAVANTPAARATMRQCSDHRLCFLPEGADRFSFRFYTQGDRISPLGMRGSRLVSDILQEARLSRHERSQTVLLTDSEGRIIWIDGLKRSRHHLITADTEMIYIVSRSPRLLQSFLEEKLQG